MRTVFCRAVATLAVLQVSAMPAFAQSDLVVTVTNGGTPVQGAFVSIVGTEPTRSYGGITGASGTHTFAGVTADTYTVTASAPGTTVGTATAASGATTAAVTVTSSGTVFSGLGAYGSQTGAVMADGRSGIFYLSTTAIPSLYRTYDYGGTWAPVTLASDDSANGLPATQTVSALTTSGSPGEVAAIVGNAVYYSRDFGVTWKSMALPSGISSNGTQLLWGHSPATSAQSQLFVVSLTTTAMHAADMSVATPSLSAVSPSYKAAAGDRLAIANGNGQSFLAVAAAAGGDVTLFRVSATPSSADPNITITGAAPSGSPTFVRLGGDLNGGPMIPSSAGTIAPNVVLVYTLDANAGTAGNQPAARLSSYVGGTWRTTTTVEFRQQGSDAVDGAGAWENGPNSCGAQAGAVGSVAPKRLPLASPTSSYGTVAMCWLEQSSADYTKLIVRPVSGINNNTGAVYDSAWGGTSGLLVMLSADGSKGMVKSDRWSPTLNRPDFPQWPALASGGFSTAPYSTTTGGVSVNGVNAAVIKDTVFQPGSSANMVVAMSFSGGGRVVGTLDSGTTWNTLESRGAGAVDWWSGATTGDEWLLSGSSGDGNLLGATRLNSTTPYASTTRLYQMAGTSTLNHASPASGSMQVLAAVGFPGTDKGAVASVSRAPGSSSVASALVNVVTLGGTATAPTASVVDTGLTITSGTSAAPNALAYCPVAGSATSVADVLFVAVGASTTGGADGSIRRITGASGSSAAVGTDMAISGTGADFQDVRVDCASGTVYAAGIIAGGGSSAPSALYRATTASGALGSLSQVTTLPSGSSRADLATLDISPSDVNQVVVVSGQGDVYQTTDGGTTWTTLNSASTVGCNATLTSCGRGFGAERPGDIEIAPASSGSDAAGDRRAGRSTQASRAVFGSGSGLYSTRLTSDAAAPTVTEDSEGRVTVSWSAVSGATGYMIYLSQGGVALPGTPVSFPLTQTSLITGPDPLPAGTYTISVAGVVGGVTGSQSPATTFTVGTPSAPGQPTAQVSGTTLTSLSWTAATGRVTRYDLSVSVNGSPVPGSPFNVGTSTAIGPIPNLAPGTYSVTARAYTGSTAGAASAAGTFTIASPAAPGAPGTPVASVSGTTLTSLTWSAPTTGTVTAYKVYATLNGATLPGTPVLLGPATSLGQAVSGLLPGSYAISVSALNNTLEGPVSAPATFTIAGPTAPGQPGQPEVTITADSVTVSWAPASGTVTDYVLSVLFNGIPVQAPTSVGNITALPPVPRSQLPLGVYTLQVTARNGDLEGPASPVRIVTLTP
jgi:hypothetical protein